MIIVKIGLCIMLMSLVSMAASIPLNCGYVSGICFAFGMVLSWIGGVFVIAAWVVKKLASIKQR